MTRLRMLLLTATLLAATLCHAQTVVSGEVTTTEWTKAAAPYSVVGTITVPAGNTLFIEAGVDVVFDADVQFIVQGALRVHGTETDSVRFIPGEATEWGGIRISGGDSSSFEYARISGGHAEGTWWEVPDGCGGGVCVDGATRVSLRHCAVTSNVASTYGGGVYVSGTASVSLRHCAVASNAVSTYGGGVYVGGAAAVSMDYCTVVSNTSSGFGGGVFSREAARIRLAHCTISENSADCAAGLTLGGAMATITDCEIVGNEAEGTGGGVGATCPVLMTDCTIRGNQAGYAGGGVWAYATGTISLVNCSITANRATYCCGLYALGSPHTTLVNCTISGNEGGGLANENSAPTVLQNCIVWGNTDYDVSFWPEDKPALTVDHSCIGSGWPGDGNIDADPLFVDAANGDYSLLAGSPCIDSGNPAFTDPDGSRSDIGMTPGDLTRSYPRVEVSATSFIVAADRPKALEITNVGFGDLSTSLELPPGFHSSVTFPREIAKGETLAVEISYVAADYVKGEAILTTSDAAHETVAMSLIGYVGTTVAGSIASTTWTKSAGPYCVADTITVPAGCLLAIEAGVDVYFDADVPFLVGGTVNVSGTESDSVRFVPGEAQWWGGIRFVDGGCGSLSYARVSGARPGPGEVRDGGGILARGTGCRLVMSNCVIRRNWAHRGGGVCVKEGADVSMTCCSVARNDAATDGGGILVDGSHSGGASATLTECIVDGNSAPFYGGGMYIRYARVTATRCSIRANVSSNWGGGFYAVADTTALTDCTISRNAAVVAGGVHGAGNGRTTLRGCTLAGNTAKVAGAVRCEHGHHVTLIKCVVSGNDCPDTEAPYAGTRAAGLEVESLGRLRTTNCTVVGNTGGAGYYNSFGTAVLRDCIVRGNSPCQVAEGDPQQAVYGWQTITTVSYSCIQGGWEGTGNIDADPLFVNAAAGDYRLQAGSPCINTGDPSLTDSDGSRSDMGAIPLGATGPTTESPMRFTLSQNLPNPFNPVTTVPYTITEAGLVTLSVYNLQGQLVRTLVQGIVQPGEHHAVWDGRDFAGRAAASGVYVYRLSAPEGALARRMLLVR